MMFDNCITQYEKRNEGKNETNGIKPDTVIIEKINGSRIIGQNGKTDILSVTAHFQGSIFIICLFKNTIQAAIGIKDKVN